MNGSTRKFLCCAALGCGLLGCGGAEANKELFASASIALEQGREAYLARNDDAALTALEAAIKGGLNPDSYEEALRMHAVVAARKGDFTTSLADLDKLERGAADLASVYAARHYVYRKQGNTAEAAKALQAAKRLNPRVKVIAD